VPLPARRPQPHVAAALRGDAGAWQALLREHGPRVWSLCRRLTREPEDAYQEVWLKVHRNLSRYDPTRAGFATWVTAITHRHLVDRHRRQRVRGEVLELPDLADPGPWPDEQVRTQARRRTLEQALRRLPEPQRRVVVLHHLYGEPLETIAEREGVAKGTVKSRLHRARARLAELIGDLP